MYQSRSQPSRNNCRSPSTNKSSSTILLSTFFEPTTGSPLFHPVFAIMMDQTSSTATPSSSPTPRHASAYFLVYSAVRVGSFIPWTRLCSSSLYSHTGGTVKRISRGSWAVTLGCCMMSRRFCLYWASGTCWPVGLPGKQASLAPKNIACTVLISLLQTWRSCIIHTMNRTCAWCGFGMNLGRTSRAIVVV